MHPLNETNRPEAVAQRSPLGPRSARTANRTPKKARSPATARPTSTSCGATSTQLSGLFGQKRPSRRQRRRQRRRRPDMKSAGIGAGVIAGDRRADLAGQRLLHRPGRPAGVVITVRPLQPHGRRRLPLALAVSVPGPRDGQRDAAAHRRRSAHRGRAQATGLRDSPMLTQDENIVDIRFTVQYRLKDARGFLFENRDPDDAVRQAAESAVREIVGKSKIDSVLYEQRDAIAVDAAAADPAAARPLQDRHRRSSTSTCRACSRPSRCRPRSTTRSRPARTASA